VEQRWGPAAAGWRGQPWGSGSPGFHGSSLLYSGETQEEKHQGFGLLSARCHKPAFPVRPESHQ